MMNKTEAKSVAKLLRSFMNVHEFTVSDIQRGLVVILNAIELHSPGLMTVPNLKDVKTALTLEECST